MRVAHLRIRSASLVVMPYRVTASMLVSFGLLPERKITVHVPADLLTPLVTRDRDFQQFAQIAGLSLF